MSKLLIIGIVCAATFTGFSDSVAQKGIPAFNPNEVKHFPKGFKVAKRTGGRIARPNTQHGKVVVFNAQKKVALADFRKGLDEFAKDYKYKVEFVDSEPATPKTAAEAMKKADAQVAVFLTECSDCGTTFLVAPEQHWAIVNVAAITKGAKDDVFAAARTRKEVMRAFLCAAGAMDSQYPGSMMSPVKTPDELDKVIEDPPVDAIMRAQNSMKSVGLTPLEITTYLKACQEGWAPAPTNEFQKAVWDKVHSVPDKPLKIEFDPASQKGKVTK